MFTFHIWVANEVERTGAFLDVVDNSTLSVDSTGSRKLTEVDAASLLADLGSLAVLVEDTLHPLALHLGVALQSLRTGADGAVVGDDTFGGGGTVRGGAGVLARAITAHLLVTTVSVQQAAGQAGASLAEVALRAGDCPATLLTTPA